MASKSFNRSVSYRKRALVIGNQNYSKVPLKNPVRDVEDMEKALITCGFEVTPGINCTRDKMLKLKRAFIEGTKKDDLVLFYYSGHGIQHNEHNYLIPVEVEENLKSSADAKDYCIEAQDILDDLSEKTSYLVFFILDCCRTNSLDKKRKNCGTQSSGLHAMKSVPSSIIFYACRPGTVADDGDDDACNSLFTKYLSAQLKIPNQSLDEIIRSVTSDVFEASNRSQLPSTVSTVMIREPIVLNAQVQHETTRTQVPIQPRKVAEKPNAPPKPPAEFDEEGKFKEVNCEGRRCAKCGRCRDWYFTGDSKTWKWVQGWENWKDDDWNRYWDNDVHELWKKRTDGATCDYLLYYLHYLGYDDLGLLYYLHYLDDLGLGLYDGDLLLGLLYYYLHGGDDLGHGYGYLGLGLGLLLLGLGHGYGYDGYDDLGLGLLLLYYYYLHGYDDLGLGLLLLGLLYYYYLHGYDDLGLGLLYYDLLYLLYGCVCEDNHR